MCSMNLGPSQGRSLMDVAIYVYLMASQVDEFDCDDGFIRRDLAHLELYRGGLIYKEYLAMVWNKNHVT